MQAQHFVTGRAFTIDPFTGAMRDGYDEHGQLWRNGDRVYEGPPLGPYAEPLQPKVPVPTIPTRRVRVGDDVVTINAADFDPSIHTPWDPPPVETKGAAL